MRNPSESARRSRQVGELLKPNGSPMGKMLAKARQIDRIDRKLKTLLDPAMTANVQVANISEQCLVLITSSSALATRLRLDAGQIVQTLNASGEKSISEIRVRVVPTRRTETVERTRRELPEIAKRSLERFAADSGDPEIEAIVRKKSTRTTGQ